MCKASCSKIIESLYLKRETRNHPLATLAPWNMLPPLLSSKRFQLLSLILCYFCRPSYLVRMNCTAFCGVTKPPNLTASHGWMLWGYVKCWAWLCHCTSHSSGCENTGMQKPCWVFILAQGAPDLSSSFSFCLFFYFLGSSSCPNHWMALDHTTDLVLLWGTRWGRAEESMRIFKYATQVSDGHFYIPAVTKATLSLQSAFKDLLIIQSVIFLWLVTCKSEFWRCFHLVTTVPKMCGSMLAGTGRTCLA